MVLNIRRRQLSHGFEKIRLILSKMSGQSSDVNPIQNLRADIKKAVFEAKAKTATELWEIIQVLW